MDKIIGQNIRRLREVKGISRREFALLIGCSPTQVVKYESGRDAVKARALPLFQKVLGVKNKEEFYVG